MQNAVVADDDVAAVVGVGDIVDAAVVAADIAADIVVAAVVADDLVLNLNHAKLELLAKDVVANYWVVIIIEHWLNDAVESR